MESPSSVKYLNQEEAINIDKDLFDQYGYSVYQLMELAGLSVAQSIAKSYPLSEIHNKIMLCCGPGNNGGDGLVAARHLKLFGYTPIVIYPKEPKQELYKQLLKQCEAFDIQIYYSIPEKSLIELGDLIVDCIFGFSFKPPNKNADFAKLLKQIDEACNSETTKMPLISVDIPSGWHVEKGPDSIDSDQAELDVSLRIPTLKPDCLISLTAPKLCAFRFEGRFHYLGGRFCPEKLIQKYKLTLPNFPRTEGIVQLDQQTHKPTPSTSRIMNQGSALARNLLTKLRTIGL